MKKYIPSEIESKWQKKWLQDKIYAVNLDLPAGRQGKAAKKFYLLVEFTYPSGDLHIGHWFAFAVPDVLGRFKRMQGYHVFYPNGFDGFGLPAENAAIKKGVHPRDWTLANIENMKKQFSLMGAIHDWENSVITCLPEYYKWNQWIFLKMLEKGIAYKGRALANWCPKDLCVLANENVEAGKCWRCGTEVIQKEVEQWFLKITEYAERLLWPEGTERSRSVDWPKPIREGQNNWIGKSEGLIFTAPVKDSDMKIQTFSAHFQAFYADTFVVIAPDHPLLAKLIKDVPNKNEIMDFANKIVNKRKDENYQVEGKEIEGIFTGKYIIDPIGNGDLPIWVASYALKDYGTGIVKCSIHDERDFVFAKKYGLKLKPVLFPEDSELRKKVEAQEVCYTDMKNGILSEPKEFAGKKAGEVRNEIIEYAEKMGFAKRTTQYHLHDWSISRQRYWGTPIPIINCPNCGVVAVPEKDLPVELPYEVDYTPKGEPPLATNKQWLNVKCPNCGGNAKREAETMDTFVDSSWYFLRYLDNKNDKEIARAKRLNDWMMVDIYFGGAEHTLGHTLYSRFFIKFLKDIGVLGFEEYAKKRVHHGVILGPDGSRMSKSRGNVVNPDTQVKEYGADSIRLYLCFIGPYDIVASWNPGGMGGVHHFLQRVWGLQEKVTEGHPELDSGSIRIMHKTIKKVTEDIEVIKLNTAVASLMEWLNHLSRKTKVSKEEYKNFLLLLASFAPHITEEIWASLGEKYSIHQHSLPLSDNKYLEDDRVNIAIQINGKVRATIMIQKDTINNKETIEKKALENEMVQKFLESKPVKKVVYIPGKIISFVVSS